MLTRRHIRSRIKREIRQLRWVLGDLHRYDDLYIAYGMTVTTTDEDAATIKRLSAKIDYLSDLLNATKK